MCQPDPKRRFVSKPARRGRLFVQALGPKGSGHFFQLAIGYGQTEETRPKRGICLSATTAGWRTLRRFRRLAWLDDIDGDGATELIVWSSTPFRSTAGVGEQALIPWVFSQRRDFELRIDLALTRKAALEVQQAYERVLPKLSRRAKADRRRAAEILEALQRGSCNVQLPQPS